MTGRRHPRALAVLGEATAELERLAEGATVRGCGTSSEPWTAVGIAARLNEGAPVVVPGRSAPAAQSRASKPEVDLAELDREDLVRSVGQVLAPVREAAPPAPPGQGEVSDPRVLARLDGAALAAELGGALLGSTGADPFLAPSHGDAQPAGDAAAAWAAWLSPELPASP